jgi:DNA-binding MarR family transcriptional regulator
MEAQKNAAQNYWLRLLDMQRMCTTVATAKGLNLTDRRVLEYLMGDAHLEGWRWIVDRTQEEISKALSTDRTQISRSMAKLVRLDYVLKMNNGRYELWGTAWGDAAYHGIYAEGGHDDARTI